MRRIGTLSVSYRLLLVFLENATRVLVETVVTMQTHGWPHQFEAEANLADKRKVVLNGKESTGGPNYLVHFCCTAFISCKFTVL